MLQRTAAFLILAFLISSPGIAQQTTLKMHTSLSSRFVRSVKVPMVKKKSEVRQVIYGNKHYGYYTIDLFKKAGANIQVKIVPPGYKHPIEFYVGYQSGDSKITFSSAGSKKFKSPVMQAYKNQTGSIQSGSFSSNFFLVGGSLPKQKLVDPNFVTSDKEVYKKDKYRFTYVQILNRLGEIVWIHVPTYRGGILSSYLLAEKTGTGKFGLMFGKKAGLYTEVDIRGRVLKEFSSRFSRSPFTMHHDFHRGSKNELITVSNKSVEFPKNKRPKGMKSFLTDEIVSVDLKTNKKTLLLDFLTFFKPWSSKYWTGDKIDDKKFTLWGKPKADIEFTHVNSIDHYPGQGYLIGIRNLNKIAFFSEDFKTLKWTVGPDRDDTYRLIKKDHQFLHMHTPILLENGNLLVFDNGRRTKSSRVVVYNLDKSEGQAKPVWTYAPKVRMFSKNRSSVSRLKNSHVLAYFVSPVIKGTKSPRVPNMDHLIEIDRRGRKRAHMTRTFETLTPGYRAVPMDQVGYERFVGFDLKKAFRSENR